NNLIQAQNDFSLSNSGQATESQPLLSALPALQYDNTAAEAQWTKLQQAQDLAVAKVQPIRVSLPTRGLRHAFTQVLQTEGGKPLTIRLMASNSRVTSWPERIAGPVAGFVVLWALVALLNRTTRKQSTPAA